MLDRLFPRPAPASTVTGLPGKAMQAGRWVRSTPFLDLAHPGLRIRAMSVTQLCIGDLEKALALHGFVARIPFVEPFNLKLTPPAQVVQGQGADAQAKAGLLVALLRLNGIAARLRYVMLDGQLLQGLVNGCGSFVRPVVEVWLNGQWLQTDKFIFDPHYLAAATAQLALRGWAVGFGVSLASHGAWDAIGSAYLSGLPLDRDPMVIADHGVFDDPQVYRQRVAGPQHIAGWSRSTALARSLQWFTLQRRARAALSQLRASVPRAGPA